MKYQMTFTEGQARVMVCALEEYFRLRLGQVSEFALDLAVMNTDLSPENPNHEKIFERCMNKRDSIYEIMTAAMRVAFHQGHPHSKTDDMMIAECMWDTLRAKAGMSRWPDAYQIGSEPMPDIEVIDK